MGIDIGSTSTNLVVVNDENKVIDYMYEKTMGKPKEVVENSIEVLKERLGKDFIIKGIGTTGSAREYIAKQVNADVVVNEITAQSKGAVVANDKVDTIFEIGGQDSKYISIDKGIVKDFEMNKICAAGTGAFIEEQIKKLGIELSDFGNIALEGDNPSNLGDRCTVFIEGNIGKAISEGESIGLKNFEKSYPDTLSGGMRQRCAIARGFNYDCDLLLMDEPLKSLDYNLRIEMLKVLINLWNKSDKSILFITHEIDEALTVANRILVLGKRPTKVIKEVILGKDSIGSRDINSDEFIGHRKEIINLLG